MEKIEFEDLKRGLYTEGTPNHYVLVLKIHSKEKIDIYHTMLASNRATFNTVNMKGLKHLMPSGNFYHNIKPSMNFGRHMVKKVFEDEIQDFRK